jgi:hypothetical protein
MYSAAGFIGFNDYQGLQTNAFQTLGYQFFGAGRTASSDVYGTMRSFLGVVDWAGPQHFFTDGGSKRICVGDSGGPALERNAPYVMGIASRAQLDGPCTGTGDRQRYYKVRRETAVS